MENVMEKPDVKLYIVIGVFMQKAMQSHTVTDVSSTTVPLYMLRERLLLNLMGMISAPPISGIRIGRSRQIGLIRSTSMISFYTTPCNNL